MPKHYWSDDITHKALDHMVKAMIGEKYRSARRERIRSVIQAAGPNLITIEYIDRDHLEIRGHGPAAFLFKDVNGYEEVSPYFYHGGGQYVYRPPWYLPIPTPPVIKTTPTKFFGVGVIRRR